jgi:hypothetical protein
VFAALLPLAPAPRPREAAIDAHFAEPTPGLDLSVKRARRTPKKITEKEHVSIYDNENEENEQAESEQDVPEFTPIKSLSRRTSIASTARSCRLPPRGCQRVN